MYGKKNINFDIWFSLDKTAVHVADYDFSVRESSSAECD